MSKLRELSKGTAIYGSGEVAVQILNFLLLPLYVDYLTKADYGIIALLATVEAPAKLLFRWVWTAPSCATGTTQRTTRRGSA